MLLGRYAGQHGPIFKEIFILNSLDKWCAVRRLRPALLFLYQYLNVMAIVYFSDQYWPSISGVSVSVDAFKKQLCLMGYRVILFVPDYPGAEQYDQNVQAKDVYRFKSHNIAFNDENRLVCRSEKKKIFALLDTFRVCPG